MGLDATSYEDPPKVELDRMTNCIVSPMKLGVYKMRISSALMAISMVFVLVIVGCSGGGSGGGSDSGTGSGTGASNTGRTTGGSSIVVPSGPSGLSGLTGSPSPAGTSTSSGSPTPPVVMLHSPVPINFQSGQLVTATGSELKEVSRETSFGPIGADFNGDGIPDLMMTGNGAIAINLGQPDGTFGSSIITPYPNTSGWASSGYAYDVNGDGKLDVITFAFGYPTPMNPGVYVFLGNGDGTFQPGVAVPGTINPLDLAFGDVDADGHPDMVVAQSLGAFYYHGHGDGTFDTGIQLTTTKANRGWDSHNSGRDGRFERRWIC